MKHDEALPIDIDVKCIHGMDIVNPLSAEPIFRIEARMTEAQMFAAVEDFRRHLTSGQWASWVDRIEELA